MPKDAKKEKQHKGFMVCSPSTASQMIFHPQSFDKPTSRTGKGPEDRLRFGPWSKVR